MIGLRRHKGWEDRLALAVIAALLLLFALLGAVGPRGEPGEHEHPPIDEPLGESRAGARWWAFYVP